MPCAAHKNKISHQTYDEWNRELDEQQRPLEVRLSELDSLEPLKLPNGALLRDLWPSMTIDEQRQILDVVIKEIVVKRAPRVGSRLLTGRLQIHFRPGYAPPRAEVDELIRRLEEGRVRDGAKHKLPPETQAALLEMHQRGLTASQISAHLRETGAPPPGRGAWRPPVVTYALRWICQEHGIEYIPTRRDTMQQSLETLDMMLHLWTELQSFAACARELNKLGMKRPNGKEWTGNTFRQTLRTHAERLGLEPPTVRGPNRRDSAGGRPRYLTESVRHAIWKMHRKDLRSLREICRWLESQGVRTTRGLKTWQPSAILAIVRSVDEESGTT